jgi:gamma-glutamyltranspeptidase
VRRPLIVWFTFQRNNKMFFNLPSFADKPVALTFDQLDINPADYNSLPFDKIRPEYINIAAGLLLNNRLFGFTADPSHPNCVAPKKRPAHTLCPAMVFRDGRLRYALGTPGGPGQTITLTQVIEAMLDKGATLQDAISAPRWSMDLQSACVVEETMPEDIITGARESGIEMKRAGADSPFFGSAEGIELHQDGTLTGVADSRRDAAAQGA